MCYLEINTWPPLRLQAYWLGVSIKALRQIQSGEPICMVTQQQPLGFLRRSDVNDVIYDDEGAQKGRYGFT